MLNTTALRTKPTLEGDRVRLVPMVERHAEPLFGLVGDDELRRLTGTHAEFTLDGLRAWCAGRAGQDDRLDLVIEDRATGAFLGDLALLDVDAHNETAGFRIALDPRFAGQGLGTEATRLLLAYAFDEIGLHRVELEVFDFNERAIRSYRKNGFVEEGRRRDALLWAGERHDAITMAALRRTPSSID